MFIPWWGFVLAAVILAYIIFAVKMSSEPDTHGIGHAFTVLIGIALVVVIALLVGAYWLGKMSVVP